jgi:nucleoid DNA-binding protein
MPYNKAIPPSWWPSDPERFHLAPRSPWPPSRPEYENPHDWPPDEWYEPRRYDRQRYIRFPDLTLTRAELRALHAQMAADAGITQEQHKRAMAAWITAMRGELRRGGEVNLDNVFAFYVGKVTRRRHFLPRPPRTIIVPEKKVPKCSFAADWMDWLN